MVKELYDKEVIEGKFVRELIKAYEEGNFKEYEVKDEELEFEKAGKNEDGNNS